MNFLNLEYFVALSSVRSFSRCAKQLHISQQSLSSHIQKLEKECEVQLFHRSSPLRLTEAGQEFNRSAKAILAEKAHLDKRLTQLREPEQTLIRVGISVSCDACLLPDALAHFHCAFPQVQVNSSGGTADELLSALQSKEIDFYLGLEHKDCASIFYEKLYPETMCIVVPNTILEAMPGGDALKEANKPLPLRSFAGQPFISLQRGTLTGNMLQAIVDEEDCALHTVFSTSKLLSMLSLCLTGTGICICPSSFLTYMDTLINTETLSKITVFPLLSKLSTQWTVLAYTKDKQLSTAEKCLLQLIRQSNQASRGVGGACPC